MFPRIFKNIIYLIISWWTRLLYKDNKGKHSCYCCHDGFCRNDLWRWNLWLFTKWRFEYFKSDSELSSQPLFVTKMFCFHSNTRKMRHLLSMWIKVVLHIFSLFSQFTLIMMYSIFHYIMYVPINCRRSQSILKTENLMFFVRKKCRLWGVNLISKN